MAALHRDIIPPDQCATKGIGKDQDSMLKQLHCDIHRTMYVPFAVVSADLANCYDSVQHGCAALALCAFGIPPNAVKLVLTCLQTMSFWLRTAYGTAETPFHGTEVDPFFGIGQGSGLAPPTFQAVSTLLINGYKSLGHGVRFQSAVTGMILFFAAILYVDDTDLIFSASSPELPDEEFLADIQSGLYAGDISLTSLAEASNIRKVMLNMEVSNMFAERLT